MPLFETTPVDVEEVRKLVKAHWNAELGANVRASQNQTFKATIGEGEASTEVFVRVTPNPGGKRTKSIEFELKVLDFLEKKAIHVCPALPALESGALQVPLGELSVSVFRKAKGEFVDFVEYKWMFEEERVLALGRFAAKLHLALDEFHDTHLDIMADARNWSDLHDGVLKDYALHTEDVESAKNAASQKYVAKPSSEYVTPRAFGLIHSDLNCSNYYWQPELKEPSVFDWDQLCTSWREYDLASCIWPVVTLESAGSPVDMSKVPDANSAAFTEILVSGYEAAIGHGYKVNREILARMLAKRRELYRVFCSRALSELEPGTFMWKFCNFMNNWLSGGKTEEDSKTEETQQQDVQAQ